MNKLSPITQKSGAMTVPKLVAIILAIVVLIILIFGAGHLNPLYQRVGRMFDSVLIFFGLLDGGDALGECSYIPIEDYGSDGVSFLEKMKVPPEEYSSTFFQICDNGVCGVDFASGKDYRILGGRFESSNNGEDWFSQSKYLFILRSTSQTKKEWDLYSGFLNLAEEKLGKDWLKKFYNDMYTDRFVLYGDGSGLVSKETNMYWQNGRWGGSDGRHLLYSGGDDMKAINSFSMAVSGKSEGQGTLDYLLMLEWMADQDDVYFKTVKDYRRNKDPEYDTSVRASYIYTLDSPAKQYKNALKYGTPGEYDWQPIYKIVGKAGGNYELDTVGEITKLREEFLNLKEKYLEDSYPSIENLTKFNESVAGEKIKTAFGEYTIEIEWNFSTSAGHYPLVKLISEEETVELKFEHQTEFVSPYDVVNNGEYLRDYPLAIYYPRGLTNKYYNEDDYKLIEESFNKSYRLNLIEDFIWEQCR